VEITLLGIKLVIIKYSPHWGFDADRGFHEKLPHREHIGDIIINPIVCHIGESPMWVT
jgi:hypothetical protein